jgi:hypothetical protein
MLDHQRAQLHAMGELEASVLTPVDVRTLDGAFGMMTTGIGILSGVRGTGKTSTMAWHIATATSLAQRNHRPFRLQDDGMTVVQVTSVERPHEWLFVAASLVVVPNALVTHWQEALVATKSISEERILVLRKTVGREERHRITAGSLDVVIVSESACCSLDADFWERTVFSRLIVDDAHLVRLRGCTPGVFGSESRRFRFPTFFRMNDSEVIDGFDDGHILFN